MTHKVNFSVQTQALAYQAGFQEALSFLVDALVEGGTINHLIERLEDNANPETKARIEAYYAARDS
jgi:hypothetical protein